MEFVNVNYMLTTHQFTHQSSKTFGFHYKKTRPHIQILYSQILQLNLAEQPLALESCL